MAEAAAPAGLFPRLWRYELGATPELCVAGAASKARFWGPIQRLMAGTMAPVIRLPEPDRLTASIVAKGDKRYGLIKPHREGNPDTEVDATTLSRLEHRTPQFNLRNVERLEKDLDLENIEWTQAEIPDRRGFQKDLAEVRAARLEAPEFLTDIYSTLALHDWQDTYAAVFRENDWEKWYGNENKRSVGSLWRFVPADGGKRTRPWQDVKVVPYKYWRGRLMAE